MKLPRPFADVIALDRKLSAPVVQLIHIRQRRQARRACQVYLSGPGSAGKGVR